MTAAHRICQWIAGEPGEDDACKCGRPALAGSAYCAGHRRRAVLAPDSAEYGAAKCRFRALLAECGLAPAGGNR